jgi:hypothetical protein
MESYSNRGQIMIESLVFIIFILSLLFYLHEHIEKSQQRILRHYTKINFTRELKNAKPTTTKKN